MNADLILNFDNGLSSFGGRGTRAQVREQFATLRKMQNGELDE